ncbi:hypothetical protein UFOVP459_52 [uncultured Caudovirales phage]|uniref:Uncharacterized protein n=1 Tax=uncultured Caudovirales phage TaxID=2100421 RepID=A0A6J5QEV6_9CAUD|nr:hypothetical protein UFOVP459_52 [uncultured Caudovirales phage]CAB4183009.1 hypothetical protein UFOVP1089_33 [uncultured Caudovirales phage]CAB4212975.1 hypothetical protein UFOVP1443_52 [uncultured Caudovirales phage]
MKTVFVAWEEGDGHPTPYVVKGIFSTREKAQEFIDSQKYKEYIFIKEVIVDFKYNFQIFEDFQ